MKWITLLFLISPAAGLAEIELEFHLCSAYVQQTAAGERLDRGWPVRVQLTDLGTSRFQRFTEENIGEMTRIVVNGRKFSRATIWSPIENGNLQAPFSSQEAATAWQKVLEGKLPAAPCGARS